MIVFLSGVCFLLAHALPRFLSATAPVRQGFLVVEGWVPSSSLRLAEKIFRQGYYDAVVVSGGPFEDADCNTGYATYADRAANVLKRLGLPERVLIVAPAPASAQDRTYRSAVSVRQMLEMRGIKVRAMDVLSSGPHTRRSRNLYRLAFGEDVEIGSVATMPTNYDLLHWWRSSAGVKDVVAESVAYFWTLCCFDPGPRGSWHEAWGH